MITHLPINGNEGRRWLVIRLLWLLGSIFGFSFAVVGLILPIIPHVPFLVFGAYCLSRISRRFRRFVIKIMQKPWFQRYGQPWIDKLLQIKFIRKLVKLG